MPHRSYYAVITLTTSVRPPCIHIEPSVLILAKYWLWLPDNGFIVNWNMLGQPPLFLKCFSNSTFFNVVCISWTIKVFDINIICKVKISVIISKEYRKIWPFLSLVSGYICIFMSEVIGHRFLKERNRCTDALPGLSWYNMFPETSTALRYFFVVVYEYMESIQTALTHSS